MKFVRVGRQRWRVRRESQKSGRNVHLRIASGALLVLITLIQWGAGSWGWIEPFAVLPAVVWLLAGTLLLLRAVFIDHDSAAALLSLPSVLIGGFWLGITYGQDPPPSGRTLRVIAWNVTYLPETIDGKAGFLRGLTRYNPDLILLQEAHLKKPKVLERELRVFWPDVTVVNRGEYTLVSRYPVLDHGVPKGIGGFMWARVQVGEQILKVYNVHFFSVLAAFQRREAQYQALLEHAADDELALIGGDFNVPWHHQWVRELRRQHNFSNPAGWGMPLTLPSALPVIRVDYVFASRAMGLGGYAHLPYRSGWRDHLGILTELHLPKKEPDGLSR